MLNGVYDALSSQRIDWCFVSTHGFPVDAMHADLHAECLTQIKEHDYVIACSHTSEESYSTDGLIVARSERTSGPDKIDKSYRAVS